MWKPAQMIAYDAIIEETGEFVDESIKKAAVLAEETGWYQATAELNPLVVEAQKTISYEIFEQFKALPKRINHLPLPIETITQSGTSNCSKISYEIVFWASTTRGLSSAVAWYQPVSSAKTAAFFIDSSTNSPVSSIIAS